VSRVRVLYCIEAMVHGGTEKQLAELIRGFDRRRVEPSLCVLKPSRMDLRALDCAVLQLGFRTFRSTTAVGCVRRLRAFLRAERVDIVHTYFQDPTLLGWLASIQTPVRARVAAFRDMGFWRTPAKVAQLRLAYPFFDGFIANSAAVAQQAHELDRIPLHKIEVIPNGVRVGPLAARPRRSSPPVVGIVANLDRPVKRVDLFLRAARLVRQAVGQVEFVVIGEGHLRPSLTRQAATLGIEDAARFLGSVEDVAAELQRFDVGVISSDSEGLSNSILEYMAAAVPTVARAVGGNRELVRHGETGQLVDGDSPEALARAIVSLLQDDASRLRMGARARELAEAGFSTAACVDRHEQYYRRILAASNTRFAGKAS
jgi:L-malate glycosyltransferase